MNNILKFLQSPLALFAFLGLGVVAGLSHPPFIGVLDIFGNIFMTLLELTILPIIATMLTLCVHDVIKKKTDGSFLLLTVVTSVVIIALVFGITVLLCYLAQDSVFLQKDFLLAASRLLIEGDGGVGAMIREISAHIRPETPAAKTVGEMILDIFPANAVKSFSESNVLQVCFFSVILGIFSVSLPKKGSDLIILTCESLNHIFVGIFDFIMIFLAPAMFCIVAVQISLLGIEILFPLLRLLALAVAVCLVICAIGVAVMCRVTKTGVRDHLAAMGKPLYMAFATGDMIPSIPLLVKNLHVRHNMNKTAIDTIIPVSASLFNYNGVILLSVSFVGASSIYGVSLTPAMVATAFIVIFMLSISYSDLLSSSYMIALLLEPFGLPPEALIAMLIPLSPILDGVFTATKLYPICSTTAVMSRRMGVGGQGDR